MQHAHEQTLESLVDAYGLTNVLASLAAIALEKADHVEVNWQDAGLARAWRNASVALDRTHPRIRV